uniref:Uncharacterized protein n=1 Tax=Anguilla anguilla TaxID=7936 RepID=A0A0E9RLG3_ANGAN
MKPSQLSHCLNLSTSSALTLAGCKFDRQSISLQLLHCLTLGIAKMESKVYC